MRLEWERGGDGNPYGGRFVPDAQVLYFSAPLPDVLLPSTNFVRSEIHSYEGDIFLL